MANGKVTSITSLSKKQFDEWASSYDSGIWNLYFIRSTKFILDRIKEIGKNGVLVDVGSGTGALCIDAVSRGLAVRAIGVDLSTEMVVRANSKINSRAQKQIQFIEGQSEKLPLDNDTADFVTCLNSFHHYENQSKAIKEARRVLRTGGYYLILDPVRDGPLRQAWCLLLRRLFKEPYAKYLTQNERQALVTAEGFKVVLNVRFMYFTICSIYQKC